VLDRVDPRLDHLADDVAHHVHGEPAALGVHGVGDPRDEVERVAEARRQRVALGPGVVGDDLDPGPARGDPGAGGVDRVLGRRAVVEVREEQPRRGEERAAADHAPAAVGLRGERDARQRARVADGEHAGAALEVQVGGDELGAAGWRMVQSYQAAAGRRRPRPRVPPGSYRQTA
jgi:hypothetical protein